MLKQPYLAGTLLALVWLVCYPALTGRCVAQTLVLGSIVGHVSVQDNQPPEEAVLVTLILRGAPIESVYTDSQGTFGFHNLTPDVYEISIDDDRYHPVRERAVIENHSLNPIVLLNITLVPKATGDTASQTPSRPSGSNPDLADVREYSQHFPKSVVKEFDKAVEADKAGKKDDAVKHYLKALKVAPDFYPAHNNLGSDYLSRSEFAAARSQFEEVLRLNGSDADAYFNLSNLCMLTGDLAKAQAYLEEGTRRRPDSAFGQFLLGSLDLRIGKYEEAESALRGAIRLSPLMAQARLQLVNLLLQRGRNPEAEAELRQFVAAFPDSTFTPKAKQLLQKLGASSNAGTPK